MDIPIVSLQKKQTPSHFGPVAAQIITHEQYGGVLQKGSKLTEAIDAAITKLTANGTVGKLQKKWFNIDFGKIPELK